MRFSVFLAALVFAGSAQADPGHLAEVAGHGHWLAAGAIGAAIATALWGLIRGARETEVDEQDVDDEEAQEA